MIRRLFVAGRPVPQGSLRSFAHAKTKRIVTPQSSKVVDWRNRIVEVVSPEVVEPIFGPVAVTLEFILNRPKSHFGTGRNSQLLKTTAPVVPIRPPDIDKLVRAVLDALTFARVFDDDSQVVTLNATKEYCEVPDGSGVAISVSEVDESDFV